MKEILILLVCGILIWTGVTWIIDPEKSLTLNLDYHLFFRNSEPTKFYFLIVRIVSVLMVLLAAFFAIFVLYDGLKGLW